MISFTPAIVKYMKIKKQLQYNETIVITNKFCKSLGPC